MIYLLKRKDRINWEETAALVVVACNEVTARTYAAGLTYDECTKCNWYSEDDVSCEEVKPTPDDVPRLICRDFRNG